MGRSMRRLRNSACPTLASPCMWRSCARNWTTRCSPGPPRGWRSRRGGLRLASRAVEILGLQQQTAIEVTEAAHGRRLLRIAASSAVRRARRAGTDRTVLVAREGSVCRAERAPDKQVQELITSRAVDIALGQATPVGPGRPRRRRQPDRRAAVPELSDPHRHGAGESADFSSSNPFALLREQQWMLGPSAGSVDGEIAAMLRNLAIPESQQRIFQSDAAAPGEVQRVGGVTPRDRLHGWEGSGRGAPGTGEGRRGCRRPVSGAILTLTPAARQPAVSELVRFITTPRCTQAMLRGTGVGVTRFRPKIHVTLWS